MFFEGAFYNKQGLSISKPLYKDNLSKDYSFNTLNAINVLILQNNKIILTYYFLIFLFFKSELLLY